MAEPQSDAVFHALGDPTRRLLFEMLARDGEQNVSQITHNVSISQPMVSRHLAALRKAALVTERREGREHWFAARSEGLAPLGDWMTQQGHFWSERIDALEALLGTMDN